MSFSHPQLLDLPGIIEGAKDGKGRGKQVIAGEILLTFLNWQSLREEIFEELKFLKFATERSEEQDFLLKSRFGIFPIEKVRGLCQIKMICLLEDKKAWVATLLGTHFRTQDHKKVKFLGQDISSFSWRI